jgi:hypothetical protein
MRNTTTNPTKAAAASKAARNLPTITIADLDGELTKAAKTLGKDPAEWLLEIAAAEAFRVNYAEQIELAKDADAYRKAKAGVGITLEESQRADRHHARIGESSMTEAEAWEIFRTRHAERTATKGAA